MLTPYVVSETRRVRLSAAAAYDAVLTMPLTVVFARRHGFLPGVVEVQQDAPWGSEGLGQLRTVRTADRGRVEERLTVLRPGSQFGCQLIALSGPMRAFVDRVEGGWSFVDDDEGSLVTLNWTIHARIPAAEPFVRLLVRSWPGYARKALTQVERHLPVSA